MHPIILQGVTARSLLAAAPYTVSTTAAVRPPYAELTYPKVQALIQSAYSNSTNGDELAVKSLRSISKQGVAGNGVCETGEMPSAAENFTGQQCDCQLCAALPGMSAGMYSPDVFASWYSCLCTFGKRQLCCS